MALVSKNDVTGWLSLNDLADIPVGTAFKIQNRALNMVYIKQSSTQPPLSDEDGELVTTVYESEPSKIITSGSLETWVLPVSGKGGSFKLYCQALGV